MLSTTWSTARARRQPAWSLPKQLIPFGVEEGLQVGISSGASVPAAEQVADEPGPGHNVVTMPCDRGER